MKNDNHLKRLFSFAIAGGLLAIAIVGVYFYFISYLGFCYNLHDRIELAGTNNADLIAHSKQLKTEFGKILAIKVLIDVSPYALAGGASSALAVEYFLRIKKEATGS